MCKVRQSRFPEVIQSGPTTGASGFGMLAQAGFEIAREQSRVEQEQQRARSEAAVRDQLAAAGRKVLGAILERLFVRVLREAPNAQRESGRLALTLGPGRLEASLAGIGGHRNQRSMPAGLFRESKWDVVAAEEIVVHQQQPKYHWMSSLWYCRLPDTTEYRWYEASYWSLGRGHRAAPFSLIGSPKHADLAAAPIMHTYQFAFGPIAVDDENEDEFVERWIAVLALAVQGKLGYPANLPLRSDYWRQHFVA